MHLIQHKYPILAIDLPRADRLAFRVMHKPVAMLLVDPGAVRNLEWRGPYPGNQTFAATLSFQGSHAIREKCGVRRSVFASGILIPFVDMEELVSQRSQMLSQPLRVG